MVFYDDQKRGVRKRIDGISRQMEAPLDAREGNSPWRMLGTMAGFT
jgi:hypothetical protein